MNKFGLHNTSDYSNHAWWASKKFKHFDWKDKFEIGKWTYWLITNPHCDWCYSCHAIMKTSNFWELLFTVLVYSIWYKSIKLKFNYDYNWYYFPPLVIWWAQAFVFARINCYMQCFDQLSKFCPIDLII